MNECVVYSQDVAHRSSRFIQCDGGCLLWYLCSPYFKAGGGIFTDLYPLHSSHALGGVMA